MKALRQPVTLALIGTAVAVLLAGCWDEGRFWRLRLDRQDFLNKAQELAATQGLEGPWRTYLQVDEVPQVLPLLNARAGSARLGEELEPLLVQVTLEGKGHEGGQLEVSFSPQGEVRGFHLRPFRPVRDKSPEGAQEAAQAALTTLVGAEAIAFQTSGAPLGTADTWTFRWRRQGPVPGVEQEAEVVVRGGTAHDFELKTRVLDPRPASWDASALSPLFNLVLMLAFLFYLVQIVRWVHRHKEIWRLGGLVAVLALLRDWLGISRHLEPGTSTVGAFFAAFFDPGLHHGLIAGLLFGGGWALLRVGTPGAATDLLALLAGKGRNPRLWASLAWGLAAGSVLALLPYGLRAVAGTLGAATLGAATLGIGAGTLGAAPLGIGAGDAAGALLGWPFLYQLIPAVQVPVLAFLLFVVPASNRLIPWPWLSRALAVVAGGALLLPLLPGRGPWPALVLWALALAAGLVWLFFRHGVLAALVAAWAAGVVGHSAVAAVQPGSLAVAGWGMLASLVGLTWVAHRRGQSLAAQHPSPAPDPLPQRRLRAEREKIRAELNVAQEVQRRMLPQAPPELEGWQIAATCRPAQEVGGDLYDFLPAGEGKLGILVGDVSGKGTVASLYMTFTKGLVLAASETSPEPAEVLRQVNSDLRAHSERGIFVTLWLGVLDLASGRLVHARAGHSPVLWRRTRRRETVTLQPKGIPAGAMKEKIFAAGLAQEEVQLETGDTLFLYSDGLTEAMDAHQDQYGDERLLEVIARLDDHTPQSALEAILEDIDAFAGEAPQHDDMTLLVVRYESAKPAGG